MVENSNDWFGNFIKNYIQLYIGGLVMYVGWLFVLLGDPSWALNTITSFKLYPPEATSWETQFN